MLTGLSRKPSSCSNTIALGAAASVLSSVQFNSHLFLSPIWARTLKMPAAVPYPPPSVGAYTRTPSHQPLVFGRKGKDHLP